jgi:glucose/arabinose dehydrogenase
LPFVRPALLLALALLLSGCGSGGGDGNSTVDPGDDGAPSGDGLVLVDVAAGLDQPLLLTHAGDGSGRLFVVEKPGRVVVLGSNTTFLDITDRVGSDASEQGFLGLAFHPDFASNGVLIASYTDQAGDTVLSRFTLLDADHADPASEEVLLQVDQPFENHNGGHVVYGPDGYLYFGLGDGGLAGDPNFNGQNKQSLLGDLLRLDVGATGAYTIPSGNPYEGSATEREEIWASGLRNPWRFSFDRETGDLWIADVGQDLYEEVNHVPGAAAGLNYGWNLYEGRHNYPVDAEAPPVTVAAGFTFPVDEVSHADGHCSVTGGYVYRGVLVPELLGAYVFGDYCSGTMWRLDETGPQTYSRSELFQSGLNIASFGEDEAGELYVVDLQGTIKKFAA